MHSRITTLVRDRRASVLALFLVSILYGDVWLGITVPVSMLLLPLVWWVCRRDTGFSGIPLGFLLLLGLALPIGLQAALGRPIAGKPDAVVYLPLVYSMITMFVLQGARLSQRVIWQSLVAGGAITTAVMLVTALLLPVGLYLVPGQNYALTQAKYRQSVLEAQRAERAEGRSGGRAGAAVSRTGDRAFDRGTTPTNESEVAALSAAELGLENSPFEMGFYGLKSSVRNALGSSNYIAVFLVFLLTVCLFYGSTTGAILFAAATLATLSRTAIVFMVLAVGVWFLARRGVRSRVLTTALLMIGCAGVIAVIGVSEPLEGHLPTSVTIRGKVSERALDVLAAHPIVGAPRSHFLQEFNLNVVWNPHNFLLWVACLFGVVGVILYAGFLVVCLREIHRQIETSPLWKGVFFGLVLLITWSLFEPVALTPAFEVLVASLYTLARNERTTAGGTGRDLAVAGS